jgi:hypothetical protein
MTPTAQLRDAQRLIIGEWLDPRPVDELAECVEISPDQLRTPEGVARLRRVAEDLAATHVAFERSRTPIKAKKRGRVSFRGDSLAQRANTCARVRR